MRFFRNPEVKKSFVLFALLSAAAVAVAACWNLQFGMFTLLLSGLFTALHMAVTYLRYRKIANLAADIDRILHGSEEMLTMERYGEGELSILQNEIQKMTVCLREQKHQLQQEKIYLADSIADISHQIRTPLTSINLLVQLLREPNLTEERKLSLARELLELLSRIDWLITTLLKISKLDAGTVQLKKEKITLEELIHRATEPLLVPMELREQTLVIQGEGTFLGDLAWTCEAVGNIVKNCMEHTENGGEICIQFSENALFSEITIADSGSGIAPEDLPHIFERFYRGKNSDNKSFGVGLALARTIITGQNGTIKAENRHAGGALFTIRFYKGII